MASTSSPEISGIDFIRHLWSRRLLLLIVPVITVLGAYFYIRAFVGSTFESNAMLLLQPAPSEFREGSAPENFGPRVFEEILVSDEMLKTIIDRAREQFPGQVSQGKYESLRNQFKVESITTKDTSLDTEYSPVLLFTTEGPTPEIAHFYAEQWVSESIERYGKLRSREAVELQQTLKDKYDKVSAETTALRQQEAVFQDERELLEKFQKRFREHLYENAEMPDFPENLRRLATSVGFNQNELGMDEESIQAVEGFLRERQAFLTTEIETVRQELIAKSDQVLEVREVLMASSADAAFAEASSEDALRSELELISAPIVPEYRTWPPRSVLAIAVGIFVTAVLFFLLVAEYFLKKAVLDRN